MLKKINSNKTYHQLSNSFLHNFQPKTVFHSIGNKKS